MTQKNDLEAQVRQLEDAHSAQSELVERLRDDNVQVLKYRKTVQEQEAVCCTVQVYIHGHPALSLCLRR